MLWIGLLLAAACSGAESGVREISPESLLANSSAETLVLDVRTPAEYASGHVPNAINIPRDEIAARLTELGDDRETPVVVYCERGGRAGKAADILLESGYADVRHLEGDMKAWRESGRPIER